MFKAEIIVDNKREALYKALKPEVCSDGDVNMINSDEVRIIINAKKLSELRAKVNSYLRLIEAAMNSLDLD